MKFELIKILSLFVVTGLVSGCDMASRIEEKAIAINNYEKKAINLARENRELRKELSQLKFDMETLKSKNQYLQVQLNKKKNVGRTVASVSPTAYLKNDLVKYQIYKWTPSQLLSIAEKEFENKGYKKSAQFFHTYMQLASTHKTVDDQILFQSGLAAYESEEYYDWAINYFGQLISEYPTSQYYRGAKLWMALAKFRLGRHREFYETVEEFRKKYRNTPEWEILRGHYEEITQKYK